MRKQKSTHVTTVIRIRIRIRIYDASWAYALFVSYNDLRLENVERIDPKIWTLNLMSAQ
jgi:hypothetical protein